MFKDWKLNEKYKIARKRFQKRRTQRRRESMGNFKGISNKQAEERRVNFIKNNMGLAKKIFKDGETKPHLKKEGRLFVELARKILHYSPNTSSVDIFRQLKRTSVRNNILRVFIVAGMMLFAQEAYATTTGPGLPWEAPLQTFATSLQGPVATSVSILALIGAAASMMFFEVGRGMRWFLTAVIGFSVASTAFGVMGLFGLTSALM